MIVPVFPYNSYRSCCRYFSLPLSLSLSHFSLPLLLSSSPSLSLSLSSLFLLSLRSFPRSPPFSLYSNHLLPSPPPTLCLLPPNPSPLYHQVLLSQAHRLRALQLLARFLDLGPWACDLALSVGIFPYVLKLLQSPAGELRAVLVFIWAKLTALDDTCREELTKDATSARGGPIYFLKHLADYKRMVVVAAPPLPSSQTVEEEGGGGGCGACVSWAFAADMSAASSQVRPSLFFFSLSFFLIVYYYFL